MAKKALIIGAGVGGLSCAIRLRVDGYHVTILEKNALVGGKMYQVQQGGFRWDTGPSVITMRHVFEELFAYAGRKLDDYITFKPLDPLTRYFYRDGTIFDARGDFSKMADSIAQLDERDIEGYLAYLAYVARIHRITGKVFIYDQPPTLASFAKIPFYEWLGADPFRTMHDAIKHFVRSPHLRQLLGRFATYVGGSPYLAPATLNVIAHVELTGGVWYPQGGIYQIARALHTLAQELGVDIFTDTPVQEILVENGQVSGAKTQNGRVFRANVVVANADVTTTLNTLLPPNAIASQKVQRLSRYEPSCSGFIMLLGVEGNFSQLAHHNIFFSDDYKAEFDAIFKTLVPSENPTIYVSITAKSDPAHAPDGHENWFILVNAPPLSDKFSWEANKQAYRDKIIQQLGRYGVHIQNNIRQEIIYTPHDLQHMSGAWRGALYGPSANNKFTAFLRPHNRSKDIRGLYFVGGTTHPGGGVPMVTLSAKVTSEMIVADHA
jgi:phytoene desaturase